MNYSDNYDNINDNNHYDDNDTNNNNNNLTSECSERVGA